jgi:hypothetical protein
MQRFAYLLAVVVTAATASFGYAPAALAQNSASASLINQQLDKQVKLELDGSLPEVMAQVTKQTAVPVEAQQEVWELLPWGRETTVTAKIANQTLRQALDVVTRRLGLTYVLKDESIELQPMPALRRLGRRSTLPELDALNVLSATPLQLGNDKTDLKTLLETIDQKLAAAKSPYAVENRTANAQNPIPPNAPISVPRNASMLEALEAMVAQTPATWYPWGKTILVRPKQDQVRRQLEKEITLRHDGTDVAQVLSELSVRSGVPFRYEPGTFQELAPQSRAIRLVLNATVMDALEAICGMTGLAYQVKEGEVYLWNAASSTAAASRPRTIAMLQTESGMLILITDQTCPPDVREYIEFQKNKHYDALRKMMAEQGFKPSNPATQPAQPAPRPTGAGTTPPAGTTPKSPTKAVDPNEPPGKDL